MSASKSGASPSTSCSAGPSERAQLGDNGVRTLAERREAGHRGGSLLGEGRQRLERPLDLLVAAGDRGEDRVPVLDRAPQLPAALGEGVEHSTGVAGELA